MLDDEISFATYLGETIRLRVGRSSTASRTAEQRERARVAAHELRLGVEWKLASTLRAVQQLHRTLRDVDPSAVLRGADPSPIPGFFEHLVDEIERQLEAGQLEVIEGGFPLLPSPPEFELTVRERVELPEPPLPQIARPAKEAPLTFFEVRFVDEIGEAIGGLEVELVAGSRKETLSTNPAGIATLEDVESMSANARVVDKKALEKIVDPRWNQARVGSPPEGVNTKSIVFTGQDIAGIALKPAVPNTVVIKPPFGKLFIELFDKKGLVRHVEQQYSITGPESFSGTTDKDGRLVHNEVPRGDYELTLSLEVDVGKGETLTETYKTPVVVLESAEPKPQLRMLGALPRVVMARMRGLLFDTNKCFLLPTAMEAMGEIRKIYAKNNPCQLLIVGHTDTTAEPDINDPLSVERAKSMKAYLEDNVDTWLSNYDLPGKKAWGSREDRLMITAMPDFDSRGEDEDIVEWFQRTRELEVDGKAGTKTRTQLITEYMALDGVKLSEQPNFVVDIKTHGAGENFPLKDTGLELDAAAADEQEDPMDRRVELFFFDAEFGVLPAPAAADGDEYLEWRKRSAKDDDFPIEGIGKKATVIEVHDALFRTNSCVIMPEGEAPSTEGHEAVTTVGLFATALRFNDEHPNHKLFISGHTDTTASAEFNQTLSEERAKCALALLEGDREGFVELVEKRHTGADYKQILSWCSQAFDDVLFDCDPGTIDDNEFTGIEPVRKFQASYNANREAMGVTGPEIGVDGDIGKETWGAIFDVYQFGILQELGEEQAELDRLRAELRFVDDERKALGFSEHHPVDQVGRDGVRSQSNRRVEIMYFEKGEEPDLVLAESDPDISEIYLPADYAHVSVPTAATARRIKVLVDITDAPEIAPDRDDSCELFSSLDGGALSDLSVSMLDSAATRKVDERVLVLFRKVIPNVVYSCRIALADGKGFAIFHNLLITEEFNVSGFPAV